MMRLSKTSFIEEFLVFLFVLSFAAPYIRVGPDGVVWPREYLQNPVGLPRIIEILLLLVLLGQLVYGRITIKNIMKIFHKDSVFRLMLLISLYVLIFQPYIRIFFPIDAPAGKGVVRTSIIFPLIAYIVGYYVYTNRRNINLIFVALILSGLLETSAMINPRWYPEFLLFGYTGRYSLGLPTGMVEALRASGFWDRSTQAATFMAILICLQIAIILHSKNKIIRIASFFITAIFIVGLMKAFQRIQFIAVLLLIISLTFGNFSIASSYSRKRNIVISLTIIGIFAVIATWYLLYSLELQLIYILDWFTSKNYRLTTVWPAYINFIFGEPSVLLFGARFGCDALDEYGKPMRMAHAHNQFLGWIAGIGLPMTIFFIYLFFKIYKRAKACESSVFLNNHERMVASFCIMMLFVISVISLAESPLLQEPITILVFFTAGLVSSLRKMDIIRKKVP